MIIHQDGDKYNFGEKGTNSQKTFTLSEVQDIKAKAVKDTKDRIYKAIFPPKQSDEKFASLTDWWDKEMDKAFNKHGMLPPHFKRVTDHKDIKK